MAKHERDGFYKVEVKVRYKIHKMIIDDAVL